MPLAIVVLLLVALLGHCMLGIGALNRMHAVPLPRPIIKFISLGLYAFIVGVPPAIVAWAILYDWSPRQPWPSADVPYSRLVAGYTAIALFAACVRVPQ